jgi:hypothetical protein
VRNRQGGQIYYELMLRKISLNDSRKTLRQNFTKFSVIQITEKWVKVDGKVWDFSRDYTGTLHVLEGIFVQSIRTR